MPKLITTAAAAIIALGAASGQSAQPLSFEVASVKTAAPCCAPGQWRESVAREDRIDFRYATLRYCVAFAYRLKEFQISGPDWLPGARYDIVAKASEGTRHDQLPEMMQTLLAERFKMQVHHETKQFDVFVIVVGKNGPKLKESPEEAGGSEGANFGMSISPEGVGRIDARRATMASLATTITRLVGRPVMDLTGLTGRYDLVLEYSRDDDNSTLKPAATGSQPAAPEPGGSIFGSIQQYGLKLEARKMPMDAIVVDRAERVFTGN